MCDAKVSPVRPDTSTSYLRKIKKPLIERKRRERINNCLAQLKTILLENIKQNGGTQVSKLDKADILEMTVSHLRQIHHQQLSAAMAASSGVIAQYREGYTECAAEAVRYMEASRAYPAEMVMRMRNNLTNKVAYALGHGQPRLAITSAPRDTISPRDYSVARSHGNGLSNLKCHSEGHKTPVKVKVESLTSPCKSHYSPDSGFDSAFSPLLMTVPYHTLKRESESTPIRLTSTPIDTRCDDHSPNISEIKTSQNSVLELPVRHPVPVNEVGDSPSQKQVWRPF
ncbi:hypothetical protein DPMN_158062 [Dreissena polymorpha]|uniref:Uncharacterized protein n=2 Tax=Dreissena polymorpha TaxID=45954 RepID=A0A9D4EH80_DREPO|nr:hypothetical protein DPMN_158062 [Dreissena polymorpha]